MPVGDKIGEYVSALRDDFIDPPRGGVWGAVDRLRQKKAAEKRQDVSTMLEKAVVGLMTAQKKELGYNVVELVVPTGSEEDNSHMEPGTASWIVKGTLEAAENVGKFGGWSQAGAAVNRQNVAIRLPLDYRDFESTFGLEDGQMARIISGNGQIEGVEPQSEPVEGDKFDIGLGVGVRLPELTQEHRVAVVERYRGNRLVVVGGVTDGLRAVIVFDNDNFQGDPAVHKLKTGTNAPPAGIFLVGK